MEQNYENKKIEKAFINILLKKGKKANSEKLFKNLLKYIKLKKQINPNKILKNFILNISPKIKTIELQKQKRYKKRKWKKKKSLYLYIFLYEDRQIKMPIKWLLLNKNNNKNNNKEITNEIMQTLQNTGRIITLFKNHYNEIKKIKFFL